jgi:hypothetical protein
LLSTRGPDALEQDHKHNLDNVALNYSCSVNQPRIVRHNKAKRREMGSMSGVTSIYVAYAGHNTCLDNRQSPNPQGGPGWGGTIDVSELSGGCSRTSVTSSQGARH